MIVWTKDQRHVQIQNTENDEKPNEKAAERSTLWIINRRSFSEDIV